jgi:hypothetical protein
MDSRAQGSMDKKEDGLGRPEPPTGTTTAGPFSVASSISASSPPSRRAAIDLTMHESDQPAHTHRAVGWTTAPMNGFSRREPSIVSGAVSMDRRLATKVSGAIPAGIRSRSPGSA